jgi:large subunit ribosomal protein L19e
MKLTVQRRLAAYVLKCSPKKIVFTEDSLETIKESITKADIRALISGGIIKERPATGSSKGRIRKAQIQKSKGRRKGPGSVKGTLNARLPSKRVWINKVRLQRKFIKELKDKEMLATKDYRMLYQKVKGGFFRNKRHIKLFIDEKKLVKK